MQRPKKIALVASVLIGGSLLAWQFRRPAAPQPDSAAAWPARQPPGDSPAKAVFAGHIDSPASPHDTNLAADPVPPPPAANNQAATAAVAAAAERPHPDDAPVVPALPGSFSPGKTSPAADPGPTIHDMQFPGAASDAGPERIHTIADGDTLPRLAEKYLGSADRAAELFAYNRDVLTDPDLLPIGAELRIPSAAHPAAPQPSAAPQSPPTAARPISQAIDPSASQPAGHPAAPASTTPATGGDAAPRLVPVLSSGATMLPTEPPKLIPLPPTRLAAPPRDHSYVVQPGDSLWTIAAKFYGDGRRTDLLYQANRDRLWNPNDLRPGMTLVVP